MTEKTTILKAFVKECVWARAIRTHFEELFESSEQRRNLLREVANTFFHDLNLVLLEYVLLQQCKLTDPASSGRKKDNLTTNYLLTLEWSDETRKVLEARNQELMSFRRKVVDARRKLVAHLDLRTSLRNITLGAFTETEERRFWGALQEFVDAAYHEVFDGPFDIDAAMQEGDVPTLIRSLVEAVDYGDLVNQEEEFLARRPEKMRYRDA